jgi:hypothetical protein
VIAGQFYDTATFGAMGLTAVGNSDVFAAKVSAAGQWEWASSAGSSGFDIAHGSRRRVTFALVGQFSGTAAFGRTSVTVTAKRDAFVAQVSGSVPGAG